jgi:NitT/TauT family transport system substrate-binding protein
MRPAGHRAIAGQGRMSRRALLAGAASAASAVGSSLVGFPSRAAQAETLKYIMTTSPPDPACHVYYYAMEAGFFQKRDLDVQISAIASAANATRAVLAGEAEIGWVDAVSSSQAKEGGARINCIGSFTPRLDYLLVGTKSIESVAQIPGHRFAVASIGASTYTIPKVMIERAGGDPGKVSWVSIGNSAARAQGLIAHAFDVTIINSSYLPRLLAYPQLHQIADCGEALPNFAYAWDIASETALRDKRPIVKRFMQAVVDASRWASENVDDAVRISLKLLPDAPKEETEAAIKSFVARRYWSTSGRISDETFTFTVSTLIEARQLKGPLKYQDFVVEL